MKTIGSRTYQKYSTNPHIDANTGVSREILNKRNQRFK
jgi:hypothetical protein